MWTDQVLKTILHDCVSASVLTGIYAINTLPVIVKYPAALIINLSPSTSGGSHWTCIYIDEFGRGYYFDSFGRTPPKAIFNFLQRNCKFFFINRVKYQDDNSVYCGLFCIVFIYFIVRNVNILSKFHSTNLKRNDHLVLKYVKKIIKSKTTCK